VSEAEARGRRAADPEREAREHAASVRAAELWRATGLGFAIVWTVLLVLVVAFWVRVTFYPRPGDELPGSLQILLAPVAFAAAGLAVWTVASAWRLVLRRASGWDPIVVLGAFAIAVSVLIWAPSRVFDALSPAPRPAVLALAGLGVASVVTGLVAQRAFRRAAVAFEPLDDDALFAGPDDDGFG
jgi:hypothetical protein